MDLKLHLLKYEPNEFTCGKWADPDKLQAFNDTFEAKLKEMGRCLRAGTYQSKINEIEAGLIPELAEFLTRLTDFLITWLTLRFPRKT